MRSPKWQSNSKYFALWTSGSLHQLSLGWVPSWKEAVHPPAPWRRDSSRQHRKIWRQHQLLRRKWHWMAWKYEAIEWGREMHLVCVLEASPQARKWKCIIQKSPCRQKKKTNICSHLPILFQWKVKLGWLVLHVNPQPETVILEHFGFMFFCKQKWA